MKKVMALILATCLMLMTFGFTALGEEQKGFKIGMCTANFGNSWCAQYVDDFTMRAEEYKAEGLISEYQVATVQGDLTDQINQCIAMINSGIDALLIWCVSETGVKSIVDLALANDVLVIICNETAAYEGTYNIGGSCYHQLHILTQWLAEQLPEGGDLVYISGIDGFSGNEQRNQAIQDVLANYPDIKIIAQAPGNWSNSDAQAVMTTFLSTYQFDGLLAQDVMGDGILAAYKNASVEPELITGDNTKNFLKTWKTYDKMNSCTVSYDPGIVVTCLDVAINLLQGKTFKEGILEPNTSDPNLVNAVYVDPYYVVTREGKQDVPWLADYPNTKALSLDEALEMLADKEDTAALDGFLDREVVESWFE